MLFDFFYIQILGQDKLVMSPTSGDHEQIKPVVLYYFFWKVNVNLTLKKKDF